MKIVINRITPRKPTVGENVSNVISTVVLVPVLMIETIFGFFNN